MIRFWKPNGMKPGKVFQITTVVINSITMKRRKYSKKGT